MAANPTNRSTWVVSVPFGAGDAGPIAIKAAPGADNALVITWVKVHILTSAAAAIDIESSDNATELIKLAASPVVNGDYYYYSEYGIYLPNNTALVATLGAAGNAGVINAEGYKVGKHG